MATVIFHVGLIQLIILLKAFVVEGGNSSVAVNESVSTGSNGIGTSLPVTNSTNTSSTSPSLFQSTQPTTVKLVGTKLPSSAAVDTGQGASSPPSTVPVKEGTDVSSEKKNGTGRNGTLPARKGQIKTDDDLPFWVYLLIAFGVILVITTVVIVMYARLEKWKNHGSYMVWDDNELELSPAFTRESEFLLDNLAADHEPGTPELQIYEIPLDSLGHQRVYIGTKRIAPKSDEPKVAVRLPRRLKKKDGQQFQGNTLPRLGKRDHIYSSVNDEVSSTLSEGNLSETRACGHTLATLPLSNAGFDNISSVKHLRGSSPPEIFPKDVRFTLGSRSRSGSNLFQNRPLPPAPSKRFSRSLDRLRFFDTLSHTKPKGTTYPGHHRPPPIQAHPALVKSSSFGGAFNKIANGSFSQPPLPPPRKGSIDFHGKTALVASNFRRTNLCHRHSKSLDTLLLLRELDWAAFDIDIYHSYESVQSSKSDDGGEKEPSYESVNSDEKPSSDLTSERTSTHSKGSAESGSTRDSCERRDDSQDEHPYASVREDATSKTAGLKECVRESPDLDVDQRGSSMESSGMLDPGSDPTSPYASVRISQIPGLVVSLDRTSRGDHEDGVLSGKDLEPKDSGCNLRDDPRLSTHTYLELFPGSAEDKVPREEALDPGNCSDGTSEVPNSDRLSTLTYLELLPDSGRDSVISETSSGYARPIDILGPDKLEQSVQNSNDENRKSLSDLEIPLGGSATLESNGSPIQTLEPCPSVGHSQGEEENLSLDDGNMNDFEDTSGLIGGDCDSPVPERKTESPLPSKKAKNNGRENVASINSFGDRPRKDHIYENSDFLQNVRSGQNISGQSATSEVRV